MLRCSLVLLIALAAAPSTGSEARSGVTVTTESTAVPDSVTVPESTIAPDPAAAPAVSEGATALLSGAGHTFLVTAPQGWVLDSEAGRADGLHAVFYPVGSTWTGTSAFMYAVGVGAERGHDQTLDAFIAGDVAAMRKHVPALRVRPAQELPTADGKRAAVRLVSGGAPGDEEAVAFIREPRAIVVLALTSHDHASFARSRAAFDSLVASYRFLGGEALLDH